MPKLIKIKKGLNLRMIGEATGQDPIPSIPSRDFAIIPDDFCGLSPKLLKKEGDHVTAGEAVFHDKNNPEILVVSPVSGIVSSIVRGARRKIEALKIEADSQQDHVKFDAEKLADIKAALLESGLWAFFRQRPYGIVPSPEATPRDIFISTFDSSPLAPSHTLLIDNNEECFKKGVEVLSKLTAGTVYIGCRKENLIETDFSESFIFSGPHPAGNAGTQIASIRPVNKGDFVWAIEPETVVKIGKLFTDGYVDWSCVVAITGEAVKKPTIVRATEGICISALLKDNVNIDKSPRIISGNVLTGTNVGPGGYLRFPFRQVAVIPEIINDCEMLGWASLSPKKYSASRTFFSWLAPKTRKYHFDAKINGGERAIIMAGEYDKVFPMDIYAEFLIKAIIARDIDKMEQLGIYEVVPEDFALCEFIDTSKLELQKIVREGLDYLKKEMN